MELLYFSNISQLDYVVKSNPRLLKHLCPMTNDFVVSYELERMGIDFIDEWDFLEPNDIKKNWETANSLSKTWLGEQFLNAKYTQFTLSDAAQIDIIYPFQACLNAQTVYYNIFNLYPVEKITGYFLPSLGVIRSGPYPTNRAVSSVTQAVLFYMAEKRGIPIIKLNSGYPLLPKTIACVNIPFISTTKTSNFTRVENVTDKIILIYKDDMPTCEYVAIMKVLNKMPGVRTISISRQVLEVGLQIKNSQHYAGSRLRSFWDRFIEFLKNYDGPTPEIFANTHLLFQFECIRNEMETAADYGDFFAAFIDILKPSLIIFGHEAFTIERVLVRLARDRKIFTVAFLHDGLGPKVGWRSLVGEADTILVWNDFDIEFLTSYGIDKSRLHKIGCLRYENDYVQYTSTYGKDPSKTKRAAKKKLGVNIEKPLIALTTAQINTGFAVPCASPRKHREAIKGILALVSSRPDLQFIIKSHPGFDYYELYGRLLDSKLPNLMFCEHVTLKKILEASDICVLINYCTTAALEAMLNHVPIVYLNNAIYPLTDWQQDNLLATAIHRVHTIPELEKQIDILLTNPTAKEEALAEADKQINKTFDLNETSASIRLYNFIKQTIHNQKPSNLNILLNKQKMRNILFSYIDKEIFFNEYFNPIPEKYSSRHLAYAFTYLMGIHNLGPGSIRRIFHLFQDHFKNEPATTLDEMRWFLLPAYIGGNINNSIVTKGKFFTMQTFSFYLLYPQKLIFASTSFKKFILKHFIKALFDSSTLPLLNSVFNRFLYYLNSLIYKVSKVFSILRINLSFYYAKPRARIFHSKLKKVQ